MVNFRPLLGVQSHKGTQIQTGQQWKSRPEQSIPSSRTPARMLQDWKRMQGRLDTGTREHSVCLLSLSQLSLIECSVQKFLRQERFVFSYTTSKIQSYRTGQDFKINPGRNAAQKAAFHTWLVLGTTKDLPKVHMLSTVSWRVWCGGLKRPPSSK